MIENMMMDKYIEEGLDESSLNLILRGFLKTFLPSMTIGYVFLRLNIGDTTEEIAKDLKISKMHIENTKTFIIGYLSIVIKDYLEKNKNQAVSSLSCGM